MKRWHLGLLVALAACADARPPAVATLERGPRVAPLIVAALDEEAGRFVQVTVTASDDDDLDIKSVRLKLPGRPPLAAREIRRSSVLADSGIGRPIVGVDASGGSRTSVSTGVGIGIPIARSIYRAQAVATIDLPDPKLYRRVAGEASVTVEIGEGVERRRFEVPAPLPRN